MVDVVNSRKNFLKYEFLSMIVSIFSNKTDIFYELNFDIVERQFKKDESLLMEMVEPFIQNKDNKKHKKVLITNSSEKKEKENEISVINEQNQNYKNIENVPQNKNEHCELEKEFKNPSELFDYVFSNSNSDSNLKAILIKEIKSIIDIMNKILYTPSYPILFGHISIYKPKEKVELKQKAIDESFYDGFGIE